MARPLPETFGRYRILRPLGEGGMGKVFLAARDRDGQQVAIKVLPPKRALQEEEALLRFRREMDLSCVPRGLPCYPPTVFGD